MSTDLKDKRDDKDLTQEEVSKKSGISERAYQNYERNKREPKVRTAIRIADALGVKNYEVFKEIFGDPQLQLRGNTKEPESKSG